MIPPHVKYLLDRISIVDYLSSKGIQPVRTSGDKYNYVCPIHEDTDPSFYVFLSEEHQTCKCFGCGFWGNVLYLQAKIEKVSIQVVIHKLLKDENFDSGNISEEIELDISENFLSDQGYSPEELIILLRRGCYNYLFQVDFDKREIKFVEEICKRFDNKLHAMDLKSMEIMYKYFCEKGIVKRLKAFNRKKEKEIKFLNSLGINNE